MREIQIIRIITTASMKMLRRDFLSNSNLRTVSAVAGIIGLVLMPFGLLLEVQVTAQQQTMQVEDHHPNSGSNQSSISSTAEQRQNTTTTTAADGGMMFINQTFTARWMSLVDGVKVTGISIIDNEHIAVNLSYDGEGEPPGVSVVAIANSSSDTIIGSMMQNPTSTNNSSIPILSMQSGSNYLETVWQIQHPNSATVLVQLDGDIPEGGHVMVIVVSFLHH
jgi:hypothetical protein